MIKDIKLPKSILRVIDEGIKSVSPLRIYLYGSQARGTAGKFSDFDLAFEFSADNKKNWRKFTLDCREKPWSLRSIDLLNLNEAAPELISEIKNNGTIIYES
jgi:predicted nucleotidyltransferase